MDSGPLGRFVHPSPPSGFSEWARALSLGPINIAVAEVAHYEVRRELLRLGKLRSLRELDRLVAAVTWLPASGEVFRLAAELWAESRSAGRPTADPHALDGDVLIAASAQILAASGLDVVVATTNPGHLGRFVVALTWTEIQVT
jgi:predicted nucleic acid-binding protein